MHPMKRFQDAAGAPPLLTIGRGFRRGAAGLRSCLNYGIGASPDAAPAATF